ncbi:MAG: type secretion protein [Herminiimonas sp.]|nr:type secretion protein [Herminiimonas sp.]
MDVLEDLLRIKEFREQKAEIELAKGRRALAAASEALQRARDELQERRTSCDSKERAMYADLCSRLVKLVEIDAVGIDVEEMRKEVTRFEELLETAKSERETAAQHLEQAKAGYQAATRMREKFSELVRFSETERDAESQRTEDSEMEEVRVKGPVRDDDRETQEYGAAQESSSEEMA